jgi:hypothetical protein
MRGGGVDDNQPANEKEDKEVTARSTTADGEVEGKLGVSSPRL